MTLEEKDLLLQDLCARLPYGVILNCCNFVGEKLYTIDSNGLVNNDYDLEEVKPYLFPLSSMTEEQKNELYEMCEELNIGFNSGTFTDMSGYGDIGIHKIQPIINYLLKNHFDIYGLIPMGLANDATGLNIY